MLSWFFQTYIKVMSVWKAGHQGPSEAPDCAEDDILEGAPAQSLQTLDALATKAGNAYRGAGVVVGLLGILIVLCALAPAGFAIEDHLALKVLAVAKVALMSMMLILVYLAGRKSGLKASWIAARREAEKLRYADLLELKTALQQTPSLELSNRTCDMLAHILTHPETGQIAYNQSKAARYEAIENLSSAATWIGFMTAFVCALLILASDFHLIPEQSFYILGTAFVPALVGGVHGINGFLNIGGQAEEHAKMAHFQLAIASGIAAARLAGPASVGALAEKAYAQLADRDLQWVHSTHKVTIKPA